jgi:hypothetical protein
MKIVLSRSCVLFVWLAFVVSVSYADKQDTGADLGLKIIKDELLERGTFYFVKGIIHNPNNESVKNVKIQYLIWKKWMGQDGHGTIIRDTGGLVQSLIKYIPPKQSVEFTAIGDNTAPVMTVKSGLLPDPLDAEIVAEWDR